MKGSLVTLPEIKNSIGVHFDDSDAHLSLLSGAATRSILRYIKSDGGEYQDTSGEFIAGNVPDDLKAATILLVRYFYDRPEIDLDEFSDFPPAVVSLLRDLRPVTIV